MPTDEEIAVLMRGGQAAEPTPTPETDEEQQPTEEDPPATPDAGDDPEPETDEDIADAIERREQALAQRERELEERAHNMERGFQKKMQKASRDIEAARSRQKSTREVEFLAARMEENPEFAIEFAQLARRHGVTMPDVSKDDLREMMESFKEDILEKLEEREGQSRVESYRSMLDENESRLTKQHGLKDGEWDKILAIAADQSFPLLKPGMSAAQVRRGLELAAAQYVLPKARAKGQRDLLSRTKDKVKSAAALARGAVPPAAPARASSFHEDDETALANIRRNMSAKK